MRLREHDPHRTAEFPANIDNRKPPPETLKGLNVLRREARDLQHLLTLVHETQAFLWENVDYIEKTIADIKAIVTAIYSETSEDGTSSLTRSSVSHHDAYNDAYRHILNLWEQIEHSPMLNVPVIKASIDSDNGTSTYEIKSHYYPIVNELLRRLIFQTSVITVPFEILNWLDHSRPGYYIPFHDFFGDLIPDPDDRQALLRYMKWAPNVLSGGLVDLDTGFIYRYSTSKHQRRVMSLVIVVVFAIATLIIFSLPTLLPADFNILEDPEILLVEGWIAVLTGILMHLAVGTVKRSKPPIIALGELHLLINARSGDLVLKIILAIFAYVGFIYTAGIDNLTIFGAFLVGYSLDSFVGVLGDRLDTSVKGQLDRMGS